METLRLPVRLDRPLLTLGTLRLPDRPGFVPPVFAPPVGQDVAPPQPFPARIRQIPTAAQAAGFMADAVVHDGPVVVLSRDRNGILHLNPDRLVGLMADDVLIALLENQAVTHAIEAMQEGHRFTVWGGAAWVLGRQSIGSSFRWLQMLQNLGVRANAKGEPERQTLLGEIVRRVAMSRKYDMRNNTVAVAQPRRRKPVEEAAAPAEGPSSVLEAVRMAAAGTRATEFGPSAFASAEASPFVRPGQVLRTLQALDAVAAEWRACRGNLGQSWKGALAERGVCYKPSISTTARTAYEEDYTFLYQGERVLCEAHVTLGSGMGEDACLSIHLHLDPERLMLFVAWVGAHRRNTLTT